MTRTRPKRVNRKAQKAANRRRKAAAMIGGLQSGRLSQAQFDAWFKTLRNPELFGFARRNADG